METFIAVATSLFAGLMMTRLFKKLHLNFPDVTAFLIAGLLVGPFGIGRLPVPGLGFQTMEEVESLRLINEAALGFIAFSIGSEFKLSELKQTGKTATVIGIVQAIFTALLVDLVFVGLHFILGEDKLPLSVAVTLGAIATATAPAATLMVVRQYKANGPLTKLLLPIVALDDAVGLMVFAVSFGVAQALDGGVMNQTTLFVNPVMEIMLSIVLGAIMGAVLAEIETLFFSNSNRLSMVISFVFLTIALSSVKWSHGDLQYSFSSLLVCMMAGTVFCNRSEYASDMFTRCDKWTAPLYAVFFVLSGASLDLRVFGQPIVIFIGILYVLVRCAGKYLGTRISCDYMHCSRDIRKYLGITLFPQAGVALGMVLTAQALGGEKAVLIRNVILFSVLVYELFGPSMTKWALEQAGEIHEKPQEKRSLHRFIKA